MANNLDNASPSPSPLLIFVLGSPYSGKSTLCDSLAEIYNFDHFSLGAEIRQLISPNPSGLAALINSLFTPSEIGTYKHCVTSNSLAPVHLTSKYVFERVFGIGATPGATRALIDGFPRDAARWEYFNNMLKEQVKWKHGAGAMVLVLSVEKEVARKRYVERGREGDGFEKRFKEYESNIGEIVEVIRYAGVQVIEVDANENGEGRLDGLEKMSEWIHSVGGSNFADKHNKMLRKN